MAAALHAIVTDYPTDDPGAPTTRLHISIQGITIASIPLQPGHVEWLTSLYKAEAATCRNAHPDCSGECGHCNGTGRATRAATTAQAAMARELLDALRREAAEWADDTEASWADSLWDLPPAEALTVLEGSDRLPSQLAGPVGDVIRVLDPCTFVSASAAPKPTLPHVVLRTCCGRSPLSANDDAKENP